MYGTGALKSETSCRGHESASPGRENAYNAMTVIIEAVRVKSVERLWRDSDLRDRKGAYTVKAVKVP